MTTSDAYLAFSRFGLGARPGDLAAFVGDPKAALTAEIADPTSWLRRALGSAAVLPA